MRLTESAFRVRPVSGKTKLNKTTPPTKMKQNKTKIPRRDDIVEFSSWEKFKKMTILQYKGKASRI